MGLRQLGNGDGQGVVEGDGLIVAVAKDNSVKADERLVGQGNLEAAVVVAEGPTIPPSDQHVARAVDTGLQRG